ncbi:MAG: TetR/AcrR family transcriptional regulator [Henriciella sp.]
MATQKQRSDSTRALILKAFKKSLLDRGLDKTTTQSVLDDTGLSKGAMYHHFKSKTEIIEAIYAEESLTAMERAFDKVQQTTSPLAQLKGACLAWTEEVRVPSVSKILFEIGPNALGPEKAKAIENSNSLRFIKALLDRAVAKGEVRAIDSELIAAFLNALVEQTALHELRTGTASLSVLEDSIQAMFESFRP